MDSTAAGAQARIARLTAAIGDGPHAASIDPFDILVCVLVTLRDHAALRLLYAQRKTAA